MSYADVWNQTWAGPRTNGPTTIIVDGKHEEVVVEQFETMDTDDDFTLELLQDIQTERDNWGLRSFDARLIDAMDVDMDNVSGAFARTQTIL